MNKLFFILATLITVQFVKADVLQTLKPKMNQHEFSLGYNKLIYDMNSTTTVSLTGNRDMFSLSYYYGYDDQNAFGLDTEFSNSKLTGFSNAEYSGIGPSYLRYKGNYEAQKINLDYSLGYLFGLETSYYNYNSGKGNNAPKSSGFEYMGAISYDTGSIVFGLKMSGQKLSQGKSISENSSNTPSLQEFVVNGGEVSTQSLFFEYRNQYRPNLEVSQLFSAATNSVGVNNPGYTTKASSTLFNAVKVSTNFSLNSQTQLIPYIEYWKNEDTASSAIIKGLYFLGLKMRMVL